MHYFIEDFTEASYRDLLKIAQSNWMIVAFPEYKAEGRVCLWRHDIDFSPHRAYRLAQIEAVEGVKATYFVHLHSNFYNAFEREVVNLICAILDLGHDIGVPQQNLWVNSGVGRSPSE